MLTVWYHFQEGGWAMWVILFWLVSALSVIADRFVYLFSSHQNTDVFTVTILQTIKGNYNFQKAAELCDAAHSPLSRIIKAGVVNITKGPEALQSGMDQKALEELPRLRSKVGYLALFANLAMLSGLLGTILGLIKSFGAVGGESVDPSQKARILAEGISEAMNCTAFGLFSAIVALIGYAFLKVWAQDIEDSIHRETVHFYNEMFPLACAFGDDP